MKLNAINPWQWQDNLGYAQAIEVEQAIGTLYCSGQAAMNAQGQPVNGDMSAQIKLCCQNLQTVIEQSGYSTANIVRLNIYTTSVQELFAAYGELAGWLQVNQCKPASTLLEVKALAFPELKVELEATVIQ